MGKSTIKVLNVSDAGLAYEDSVWLTLACGWRMSTCATVKPGLTGRLDRSADVDICRTPNFCYYFINSVFGKKLSHANQ